MPDALLVTSSFLPGRGGIESYLAELCEAVTPRLAVLAPQERDGEPLPRDLSYPTFAGPTSMLLPTKKVADAIVDCARELGTSKVLFGTPWPLVLLAPALVRRGLTCACIVHGAETIVPGAVPLLRSKLGRALAACELLLPVSGYTARRTRSLIERTGRPVPSTEILRARVDLERFRPDVETLAFKRKHSIEPEDKVILCFGRLVPRKGVDRIIEAMPAIAGRVPGARLVVAGTGPEESKLRRLSRRLGTHAIFTGRVPDEEAPACYASADIFVLPVVDRWFGFEVEGLGVVLLEAAACGVPCVTGRSGGTTEAVVDGVTGYAIDAGDRDALVDRTVTLLVETGQATRMGAAGRAHVAKEFAGQDSLNPLMEWLVSGIR